MREFKTILCPTDFSDDSYRALEYAVDFAKRGDGTLLLAHTIQISSGEMFEREHVLTVEAGKKRATERLEEVRAERTGGYPKCELLLDFGDPHVKLLEIIKARHVDLVVICTHGSSGLKYLAMGSVAEKLVRHAPCPVFVVHRAD